MVNVSKYTIVPWMLWDSTKYMPNNPKEQYRHHQGHCPDCPWNIESSEKKPMRWGDFWWGASRRPAAKTGAVVVNLCDDTTGFKLHIPRLKPHKNSGWLPSVDPQKSWCLKHTQTNISQTLYNIALYIENVWEGFLTTWKQNELYSNHFLWKRVINSTDMQ